MNDVGCQDLSKTASITQLGMSEVPGLWCQLSMHRGHGSVLSRTAASQCYVFYKVTRVSQIAAMWGKSESLHTCKYAGYVQCCMVRWKACARKP